MKRVLAAASVAACIAIATSASARAQTAASSAAAATTPVDSTVGLCASTSAERWCWGLSGGGVEPLAGLSSYSAVGLQIGALAQIALDAHWRLRADGSYQDFRARANRGTVYLEPNVRMLTADAVWEATGEHSGMLHPYLIGGIGAYQLRLAQTCYTTCNVNYSRSMLAGGVNAGAGVRVVFPGHWNAAGFTGFVEARWNRVSGSVSPTNDRSTTFVPVSIGFLAH